MADSAPQLTAIQRAEMREREALENRKNMPLVAEIVAMVRETFGTDGRGNKVSLKGMRIVHATEGGRVIGYRDPCVVAVPLVPCRELALGVERRRGKFYIKDAEPVSPGARRPATED